MTGLKAIHDNVDEIPEPFRELYTEKGGKWELTGISGIKTQADVDRVKASLDKERDEHKETKTALSGWSALGELDDVQGKLDRFPELETAAKGKLDEADIEEIVSRRVESTIRSKLAPVERERDTFRKERDDALEENAGFRKDRTTRKIHDTTRAALVKTKARDVAFEDALLHADRLFEETEDGQVLTREGVGVDQGITPEAWLSTLRDTNAKPHWFGDSVGGGARGSGGGGGVIGGANPFSHDGWDMTKQGQLLKEHGREYVARLAKAAGTTVGGPRPAPKRA